MVTQHDPVESAEYLLRRIPNKPDTVNVELRRPLSRLAVKPNGRDVDGISIFRERFTSAQEIAAQGQCTDGYYVVRIQAQEVLNIGLSVQADPSEGQPEGHALVPEINIRDYRAHGGNKESERKSKQLQDALTKVLNQNFQQRLVHRPPVE